MNAQLMASRPEAIMSNSKRMPAPAVNPTKANLPTTTKTKAQPSQAHQGMSDGLINIAAIPADSYLQTLLKALGARPATLICIHWIGLCVWILFRSYIRTSSTRLFFARPSSLEFFATGWDSP